MAHSTPDPLNLLHVEAFAEAQAASFHVQADAMKRGEEVASAG